ncbi:MAG TPA: PAS domain S-box protein [Solirubrobacteraceae bacterium]|nr:PAS domain S-box protein [Solirubrobacteraceae bacterium]
MHEETETTAGALERRLFELSHDGMLVAALDGSVVRVNEAACRITGRAADELVGTSLWDLVHRADRDVLEAGLAQLSGDARDHHRELRFRIVRPGGELRWLDVRAAIDAGAGLLHVVARDASARAEADEERFGDAFRDAPIGMALLAPDGSLRRVNAALGRMLARSEEELLELSIFELLMDPDGSVWNRERLRDGADSSFQAETRLRHRDGQAVTVLLSATLVRAAAGAPHNYVCQIQDITSRKEAEERLAAGEAKLAEAQQIARLGSWEWDVVADRVTWSDELYRIYGVRPDRFPGSYGSYLDKVHPDDRARVARVIETAVAERRSWSLDYRIVRPDGEQRMIHARGEVVVDETDPGRKPLVVHGTAQDVTESRRVEDALRAAEQLFRRAFDDAPIGMALIDLEGRWLRLNRSIGQMLGRTEQELRSVRLQDLAHAEDRSLDRPLMKELLAGRRRSYAVEKRYVHADGRIVHALAHVSLMHGDGERPLYFLCQLVDITERRRAEAERRAGEERLQAIIDNSPALVIVKDLEQRYALVNRRWEEMYGVSAENAIGRSAAEVLGERSPDTDEYDRQVIATGEMCENLITAPGGAEGEEVHYLDLKFPLRDAEGRVYAVCTIATDMTERTRSEKVRVELEQRLAQAQRLESVGQLAGGVAHDFNNLLSVILTCVGFAERELPSDSPVRDDIEEIGRAAERAAALTRQLLMFSRREVAKKERLDVGELVRDLERLLNRTLSERIALRIMCDSALPPVLADRAQLEQVLVNLAVNARDAMPDGGTLAITVRAAEDGVCVTVVDDGAGMPAEVADRAFEPFFTTKEPGHGTGLGLATVHGIVTDSGGSVRIDSAPGAGTTITVTLPAAAPGAGGREAPAAPPAAPPAPASATVLVVEDQDPVRRQAVRILGAEGYVVREAASADEALASWEPVDLLITDLVMPGMSGSELAGHARDRTPGLRVVYMSGHTDDEIVKAGAREGDIAFVQKPFTRDALLRAVAEALAEEPARAKPEARVPGRP